jgi:hypothetical protein
MPGYSRERRVTFLPRPVNVVLRRQMRQEASWSNRRHKPVKGTNSDLYFIHRKSHRRLYTKGREREHEEHFRDRNATRSHAAPVLWWHKTIDFHSSIFSQCVSAREERGKNLRPTLARRTAECTRLESRTTLALTTRETVRRPSVVPNKPVEQSQLSLSVSKLRFAMDVGRTGR